MFHKPINLKFISSITLALIALSVELGTAQNHAVEDLIGNTDYLRFHSNYWLNFHHFFYEHASRQQLAKLQEDDLGYVNARDAEIIEALTVEDKALYKQIIEFYRTEVVERPLIRSGNLLHWLQFQPPARVVTDTTFGASFTGILNAGKDLYSQHFWQRHDELNKSLLNSYLDIIDSTEGSVISRMTQLSGAEWNGVVRVDISTYGNWAGAYSPADDNIVVSTIDPFMHSTLFVEFVFHESSHLLFGIKSPFRVALYHASQKMEKDYPRQLWHASMFYLSGLATYYALKNIGIDHQLIMPQKEVFINYYNQDKFKEILLAYYRAEIDLETTARRLISEVKS